MTVAEWEMVRPLSPNRELMGVPVRGSLLVDGRTTRDAAAALFLSPKTVEYHLRKVYTKLGIGSRAELAGAPSTRSRTGVMSGRASI